jgi:hypothetical protein
VLDPIREVLDNLRVLALMGGFVGRRIFRRQNPDIFDLQISESTGKNAAMPERITKTASAVCQADERNDQVQLSRCGIVDAKKMDGHMEVPVQGELARS